MHFSFIMYIFIEKKPVANPSMASQLQQFFIENFKMLITFSHTGYAIK